MPMTPGEAAEFLLGYLREREKFLRDMGGAATGSDWELRRARLDPGSSHVVAMLASQLAKEEQTWKT